MSTPAFRLPGDELANGETTRWHNAVSEEIEAVAGVSPELAAWAADHRGHQLRLEVGSLERIRQIVCVRCLAAEKRLVLTASLITAREAPEPPARLRSLRRVGLLDDGTDERDATGQA